MMSHTGRKRVIGFWGSGVNIQDRWEKIKWTVDPGLDSCPLIRHIRTLLLGLWYHLYIAS